MASVGAGKHVENCGILKELNSFLANPRLRRLFCSGAPKKSKYENYYPRNKKEIPGGNNHRSEAKEDSSSGEHGNNPNIPKFLTPLLLIGFVLMSLLSIPQSQKQISFQEFQNKLLERGLVDHIVVSNKSVAKVYVKNLPNNNKDTNSNTVPGGDTNGRNVSHYKYYFNIGSIESFEEKLEETQEALGINHRNYVPVTYVSQMNFFQEFMKFGPTLLLGTLIYMGRRSGFSVGGPGGKGDRGLFNIGKAPITKMDKNAKNKVFSKLWLDVMRQNNK